MLNTSLENQLAIADKLNSPTTKKIGAIPIPSNKLLLKELGSEMKDICKLHEGQQLINEMDKFYVGKGLTHSDYYIADVYKTEDGEIYLFTKTK